MQTSINIFFELILSFFMGMARHSESMQCRCNISRNNRVKKLMFCMLINMKIFYKLILLFFMGLARHAQINQASLQCLCDLEMKLGT